MAKGVSQFRIPFGRPLADGDRKMVTVRKPERALEVNQALRVCSFVNEETVRDVLKGRWFPPIDIKAHLSFT